MLWRVNPIPDLEKTTGRAIPTRVALADNFLIAVVRQKPGCAVSARGSPRPCAPENPSLPRGKAGSRPAAASRSGDRNPVPPNGTGLDGKQPAASSRAPVKPSLLWGGAALAVRGIGIRAIFVLSFGLGFGLHSRDDRRGRQMRGDDGGSTSLPGPNCRVWR